MSYYEFSILLILQIRLFESEDWMLSYPFFLARDWNIFVARLIKVSSKISLFLSLSFSSKIFQENFLVWNEIVFYYFWNRGKLICNYSSNLSLWKYLYNLIIHLIFLISNNKILNLEYKSINLYVIFEWQIDWI